MRILFCKPTVFERFDRESFRRRLSHHLRRWCLVYLLLIVAAALFQAHYAFGLNVSPSLPQRFFLIHKGELPLRGQYVAFRWPGDGPYPAGVTFVKIIAGMAGDAVTRTDREFFVNGMPVGQAKTRAAWACRSNLAPPGSCPPAATTCGRRTRTASIRATS